MTDCGGLSQTAKNIRGSTFGSGMDGRLGSVNNGLILRCGAFDRPIATDLLRQTMQLFQDQARRLKEAKYEAKTAVDSRFFAKFIPALEGRRPEIKARTIDGMRLLCSGFSFEKSLSALEAFRATPPHAGISSIDDESRSRIRAVEDENLQLQREIGFLRQELADLRRENLGLAGENGSRMQEM
jgi:hypothetical protein